MWDSPNLKSPLLLDRNPRFFLPWDRWLPRMQLVHSNTFVWISKICPLQRQRQPTPECMAGFPLPFGHVGRHLVQSTTCTPACFATTGTHSLGASAPESYSWAKNNSPILKVLFQIPDPHCTLATTGRQKSRVQAVQGVPLSDTCIARNVWFPL